MDSVYLKKVREGDAEAFSYLVEKYSDKSYSLAFSLTKNSDIAKDIVQSAFIKAFKGIPKFREDAKFSTWLYRIVVNECNQVFRRKKTESIDNDIDAGCLPDSTADNEASNKEKQKILKDAIRRLKPKEALVIRLYYLCELNHQEIKEVTGFSLSNSKVILHRARKNLKEILETQLTDELESIR